MHHPFFLPDCYGSLIHACWDASFIKSSPSPSSTIATEGLAWGSKLCAWLFPKHMGILLLLVGSSSSNPGYSMHIEKKSNKLNPLLIHPRLKISLKLKPWKHIKQKLCRRWWENWNQLTFMGSGPWWCHSRLIIPGSLSWHRINYSNSNIKSNSIPNSNQIDEQPAWCCQLTKAKMTKLITISVLIHNMVEISLKLKLPKHI